MQDGSVTVERRKRGPDVWCFRWREAGPDGRRIHRRIVLGTIDELRSIASARKMAVGLRGEININDVRIRRESIKLADLSRHFLQRELTDRNPRISYSTKKAYAGYLEKWIDPRWGEYRLLDFRAVEFESWLKFLNRAAGTRCKIRNVMSLLFNHGRRLREWHRQTPYQSSESWVFASPVNQGRWPFLAQEIMRRHIIPVARKLGITKRIGWHTFRHTYSTLLRSTGAELKIMQELLRHSTIRVTLDTYTQAVTAEKRTAQAAVVALLFPEKTLET